MKSVIIILAVAFLAQTYSSNLLDYRSVYNCGGTTPKPKNCTQPGYFCESCTSLVACIKTDTNHFDKIAVGPCVSPFKCVNGNCTTAADPVCDGTACLDFVCGTVGMFPDPFDCQKYWICVKQSATIFKAYANICDQGYSYNAKSGVCDVALPLNGQCQSTYPVPVCKGLGQNGALEENPSIYFVCKQYSSTRRVLYPFLNRCPHGQVYADLQCTIGDEEDSVALS